MSNLEQLYLSGSKGPFGAGLIHLGALQKLKVLDLSDCSSLDDASLPVLASLRELNLSGCVELTSGALDTIEKLTGLTSLLLADLEFVNNAAIQRLLPLANSLRELSLRACPNITSEAGASLLRLQKLQKLDVAGCEGLDDSFLQHLQAHTSLKEVDLRGCPFSPEAVEALRTQRPDLQIKS
jgi:Ran GTPase-activating protein (RanGAP) involved in mRNA processing and transport